MDVIRQCANSTINGRPARIAPVYQWRGLSQQQAFAAWWPLIKASGVFNGVSDANAYQVAVCWMHIWYNEQGQNGWCWYNWGNLHSLRCYFHCVVAGRGGPEAIRAYASPQAGTNAMLIQHLLHLSRAPAPVVADVESCITRGTPLQYYYQWCRDAWRGTAVTVRSNRIVGVTDRARRVAAIAPDANPGRRLATVAHEMAHLVMANHSLVELPGEERFIECLTRQAEPQLNRGGPVVLDGRRCP